LRQSGTMCGEQRAAGAAGGASGEAGGRTPKPGRGGVRVSLVVG